MTLEAKEKAFVSFYIGSGEKRNATQAAIDAGYSERSARQIASKLLSKHDIQAEIAKRTAKVAEANDITAERLDASLLALAEADIRKAFHPEDGTPLALADIPDDVAKAITGIEVDEDGHVIKFRFAEKTRPIELLLKRHKLLVERHEHTGKDGEALPNTPNIVLLQKLTLPELKGLAGMRQKNGNEAAH